MTERLFIQICELVLLFTISGGILFICAATWYDIRSIRQRKSSQSILTQRTTRRRPQLTVLIYAHNAAATIHSCIRSIEANKYPRYSIIIANNASTDGTRKQVTAYTRQHPNTPIRMYSARGTTDRKTLLRRALNTDRSGQIVITLDANNLLSTFALQSCASRFVDDPHLAILRIRHLPAHDVSIQSLPSFFNALSLNILLKSFARYPQPYWHRLINNGYAFKRSVLNEPSMSTFKSVDYASNITYRQSPLHGLSTTHLSTPHSTLTSLLLLVATSLPIIMVSYFFYTAALLQSNSLLTLSWTAITFWLLAVLWLDDMLPRRTRLDLSITVPFMYFYYYVYAFGALIALFHKIISSIPTPVLPYDKIQHALLAELYSTHY
jgi:glycosyltransferase involved in cell wall biosynthesis